MRGRGAKLAVLGALIAVLAAAAVAGAEEGVPLRGEVELEATVIPKVLPKGKDVPVGLEVRSQIEMLNRSKPPPLNSIRLHLDRDLKFDFAGVPTCDTSTTAGLTGLDDLERWCPEAIVGRGAAEITISFGDTPLVYVNGPMLVLNGGRKEGPQKFFLMTEITAPVPALIVATATVRDRRRGGLGPLVEIEFPKIAGGSGSLNRLRFRINRRMVDTGRPHPILSASCSDGAFRTELEATYAYPESGEELVHSEQRARKCGRR